MITFLFYRAAINVVATLQVNLRTVGQPRDCYGHKCDNIKKDGSCNIDPMRIKARI